MRLKQEVGGWFQDFTNRKAWYRSDCFTFFLKEHAVLQSVAAALHKISIRAERTSLMPVRNKPGIGTANSCLFFCRVAGLSLRCCTHKASCCGGGAKGYERSLLLNKRSHLSTANSTLSTLYQ